MSEPLVIDVEATGFVANEHRIIEIAVVGLDSSHAHLHTYLDPECSIPEHIVNMTNITDDMVRGAPKFRDIAPRLHELISGAEAVVGYNPQYDRRMIVGEFNRLGDLITPPRWPILVCAKRMWDIFEPKEERKLQNAYKRFVNDEGFEGAHGALADTIATRAVFVAQRDVHFKPLMDKPWRDLDPESKTWWMQMSDHVRWNAEGRLIIGFGKYKNSYVKDVDKGYWNWIRGADQDFPEHIKRFADYMVLVFYGGKQPLSEQQLTEWARAEESK